MGFTLEDMAFFVDTGLSTDGVDQIQVFNIGNTGNKESHTIYARIAHHLCVKSLFLPHHLCVDNFGCPQGCSLAWRYHLCVVVTHHTVPVWLGKHA